MGGVFLNLFKMFRAPKSQLIELIMPANAAAFQPVYFNNQPQLQSIMGDRAVYIVGMETYSSLHMDGSPITSGSPMAVPDDLRNGTLTLNVAGSLDYQQIPLVTLNRTWQDSNAALEAAGYANSHSGDLFLFEDLYQVDWTKSYVQSILTPPRGVSFSYIFNVYYYWGAPKKY